MTPQQTLPRSIGSSRLLYVICRNGDARLSPQSSQELLINSKPGPYTSMRTVRKASVLCLDEHIARLASSSLSMLRSQGFQEVPTHLLDLVSVTSLRPHVVAQISAALKMAYSSQISSDEYKVMVLLTWFSDTERQRSFEVVVHVSELRCVRCDDPVNVVVTNISRDHYKGAKDSAWVSERSDIEQEMISFEANEALMLCGHPEVILEGLSSNVFCLDKMGVLHTASAEEGIVAGTIRGLVLRACANAGIPVKLQAPKWSCRHEWQACFITSTSRLVLPVKKIIHLSTGKVEARFDPNALSTRILVMVQEQLESCSVVVP